MSKSSKKAGKSKKILEMTCDSCYEDFKVPKRSPLRKILHEGCNICGSCYFKYSMTQIAKPSFG